MVVTGDSTLLSKAEATVRVDPPRVASMLDFLVCPRIAYNNGKRNSIGTIQLSDYPVKENYRGPVFFCSLLLSSSSKRKKQEEKGERKNRPPNPCIPVASNPFASCLCTIAFLPNLYVT
jgi:hypothetical protein